MKPHHLAMMIVALMAAVLFLGCAKNNNPAAPAEVGGTPERQAEYFTSALPLFIPAAPNYYGYNDVDSAVLLSLSTHNPAQIGSGTWTAFVSLERRTVSYFVPVFHWVPSGPGTPLASPPDSVPYSPGPCYRFPKCDAVQFANGSIELAVCYEVLDSTNLDWDIGVTRIVWASAGVFPGTFTRYDQVFDGVGINWWNECTSGNETDEHWPDISYDPDNGDIYLAYSDFVSGLPLSYSQLKYRRFPRSSGFWSQEYSASPLNSYSATMPRIDVGRMDGLFGVNDLTCIGITYAAQFCNNHTGYHVHVIYWGNTEPDEDKVPPGNGRVGFLDLRNWAGRNGQGTPGSPQADTYYNSAGMPYVDIGPYNNTQNYGAIVYVQLVGVDYYGPVAEVWIIDSVHCAWTSLMSGSQTYFDGLYPSIGLHYESQNPPHWASVTYFRQSGAQSNTYVPWVLDVDLDTDGILAMHEWFISGSQIAGIYNSDQIPFTNPGAASAIAMTTSDNSYWAAWSTSWLMEPAPTTVMAAWGNPDFE